MEAASPYAGVSSAFTVSFAPLCGLHALLLVSGGFMGRAINVGEAYAHLVRDLHGGTYNTPGFECHTSFSRPTLSLEPEQFGV